MTPLANIQLRDPFILADARDGVYRLYGTTAFGGPEEAPDGFVVRHSRDLVNWSEPRPVLPRALGPVGADYYWAPEVHLYHGRWYLFASFSHGVSVLNPQRRYTGISAASHPDGPFHLLGGEAITPPGWWAIDGTLFVDEAGRPWLVFCREWLQVHDGEMHALPLSEDLTRPAGEPRRLFCASEAPWSLAQRSEWGEGYRVTDGPWLHRTATGALLMLWSSFGRGGYLTGVAHSPSGAVTGPWLQGREPLYRDDGGHGMIFRTFDHRLMLVLHTPNRPGLERVRLLPLREQADGFTLAISPSP